MEMGSRPSCGRIARRSRTDQRRGGRGVIVIGARNARSVRTLTRCCGSDTSGGSMLRHWSSLVVMALSCVALGARAADGPKPVKVFILAGQSNMEGKAKVSLLEYQAKQP